MVRHKGFVCLYPALVTKPILFCPIGATATFKTTHIVLHILLNFLQIPKYLCLDLTQLPHSPCEQQTHPFGLVARRRTVHETKTPQKCLEAVNQLVPDSPVQSSCALTPTKGRHRLCLKSWLPLLLVAGKSSGGQLDALCHPEGC